MFALWFFMTIVTVIALAIIIQKNAAYEKKEEQKFLERKEDQKDQKRKKFLETKKKKNAIKQAAATREQYRQFILAGVETEIPVIKIPEMAPEKPLKDYERKALSERARKLPANIMSFWVATTVLMIFGYILFGNIVIADLEVSTLLQLLLRAEIRVMAYIGFLAAGFLVFIALFIYRDELLHGKF